MLLLVLVSSCSSWCQHHCYLLFLLFLYFVFLCGLLSVLLCRESFLFLDLCQEVKFCVYLLRNTFCNPELQQCLVIVTQQVQQASFCWSFVGEHGALSDPNRSDFESQIASDCNRNSKKITATPKRPGTLRLHCDFCGKSLRLRKCDWQSLAICDCDCVGN